jgi:tetratricopeptide (TPR) repeat protein
MPSPPKTSQRDDVHGHVEPGRDLAEEIHYELDTKSSGEEISRRQAMTFLISTPATIFRLTPDRQSTLLHSEEILALSKVNIPLCWKLYFEGGFTELKQVLPGYLTQLAALAQSTSRYSQQAAGLASQGHQLAYLLALQSQDFGTALKHTHDAAHYGEQAADVNLRVTAMVRQAYIYFCLKRSVQRLHTYEEALHSSNTCSPLIRGYVYAGLAEAYANRKEKDAALEMLQRAYDVFPERPEDDLHFAYTHFRWLTLHNLEGLVYLHLGQAQQAWSSFGKVDQAVAQAIVPQRVEVTVYQAATAVKLGELEQSCSLLTIAVEAAVKLGSHLRYQEASRVYDQMQMRWPREQQVKTLQELFR